MKRGIITCVFVLVLVILALNFSTLPVEAQTGEYEELEPKMTTPLISVVSPENSTVYNTSSVQLIANISAPEVLEISPKVSKYYPALSKVYYKGDWLDKEIILYPSIYGNQRLIHANINLTNVPEGKHELKIIALGTVDLNAGMFAYTYHTNSETTIDFTIHAASSATPSVPAYPSMLIIATLITIVTVTLIYKSIKHKDRSNKEA